MSHAKKCYLGQNIAHVQNVTKPKMSPRLKWWAGKLWAGDVLARVSFGKRTFWDVTGQFFENS